jgi:hypothetical protein
MGAAFLLSAFYNTALSPAFQLLKAIKLGCGRAVSQLLQNLILTNGGLPDRLSFKGQASYNRQFEPRTLN